MWKTKWFDCESCGEGVECDYEYDEISGGYDVPEICPHCDELFTLGGGASDDREDFHSDG